MGEWGVTILESLSIIATTYYDLATFIVEALVKLLDNRPRFKLKGPGPITLHLGMDFF
jgi:hypothetical protein